MEQHGKSHCQIHSLDSIHLPFEVIDRIGYVLKRTRRFLKRRWKFILNSVREKQNTASPPRARVMALDKPQDLRPGDSVRIRSRQEISVTLDKWNQSRGCAFMEEMWRFCGSVQRVRKCVRKFLDERDYKIKKCRGIVILEGITCEGTRDFGDCDRSCFFFWREEWLEKIGQESFATQTAASGQDKNVQHAGPE